MVEKHISHPILGRLTCQVYAPIRVRIFLPKETPATINRVKIYFSAWLTCNQGKWEMDYGQKVESSERWDKEISNATRDKVFAMLLAAWEKFWDDQFILRRQVHIEFAENQIKVQQDVIQSIAEQIKQGEIGLAEAKAKLPELEANLANIKRDYRK